jgi:hypothetical protein
MLQEGPAVDDGLLPECLFSSEAVEEIVSNNLQLDYEHITSFPKVDIYRGLLTPEACAQCATDVCSLHAAGKGSHILNGEDNEAAGRDSVLLPPSNPFMLLFINALTTVGELTGRVMNQTSGLVRYIPTAMDSCVKQRWHIDFPDKSTWPSNLSRLPRTAWVVTEAGAGLDMALFPGPIAFRLLPESLRVGDIVVFDGDVVHRGIEYDHENVSAHAYLDVAGVMRVRRNIWLVL